jgi:hypothetical protein
MRPRKLDDDQIAKIEDIYARVHAARERCRQEIAHLPTPEQLAVQCGCSVALVRLIGGGHRYRKNPPA